MSTAAASTAWSRPKYFTRGTLVVCAVAALGCLVLLVRFMFGLGATTNLTDANPWGLWIAIDVACGVALAAGGFTSAFLIEILNRKQFHALLRPALLTAMIGYTFVAIGVATDLGRWWALWHVPLPPMWQPNSVLFEVAMCVMCYLSVLYIEFIPVVCVRFRGRVRLPGRLAALDRPTEKLLAVLDASLGKFIMVFVILGIMLSCMHQSSLGTLMVIADTKLHTLWQTPFLPLMFLLSAFSVGYPMVIFESIIAHRSLRLPAERELLSKLAAFIPIPLGLYLTAKLTDLTARGALPRLLEGSLESYLFLAELGLGVVTPLVIFLVPRLRRSIAGLFIGASLVIGCGVVLNRLDVFLIAYTPVHPGAHYSPSWMEFTVTAGFVAMIVLIYRLAVLNFPVIEALEERSPPRGAPEPRPLPPRPPRAPRPRPRRLAVKRARPRTPQPSTTRDTLAQEEYIP